MQAILQRFKMGLDQAWIKTLPEYYNRPEWELFDLKYDPLEQFNVVHKQSYKVKRGKGWPFST